MDLRLKENKMRDPIDIFQDLLNKYEQALDDLASYINMCSDLKEENERLKQEAQARILDFAGWTVVKSVFVPISQIWINSAYDLDV